MQNTRIKELKKHATCKSYTNLATRDRIQESRNALLEQFKEPKTIKIVPQLLSKDFPTPKVEG